MGFLAGFIGSAPFAWGLLASQLESGAFVRGLWYFFGIVTAAGIFAGIAGLGLGFVGGLLWEQFHRLRRRERLKQKELVEASTNVSEAVAPPSSQSDDQPPRLQLVGSSSIPLPNLAGRTLRSVRFFETAVELDFGALRVGIGANAIVSCGSQKNRYPESGSCDAICALIGSRVDRIRVVSGDRVEISYENGCDVTISRSALAVA